MNIRSCTRKPPPVEVYSSSQTKRALDFADVPSGQYAGRSGIPPPRSKDGWRIDLCMHGIDFVIARKTILLTLALVPTRGDDAASFVVVGIAKIRKTSTTKEETDLCLEHLDLIYPRGSC
ncbi:hypothetical protein K3495_g9186 [Podosphaera aphanis]|nr:hypothetical protein K3495_g9186 [Podosphaera aphanis]